MRSAVPAGWDAKPVAVPHFLTPLTTQHASQAQHSGTSRLTANYAGSSTAYGLTPAQVRGAYGVSGISFNGVTGDGSGETIAIVDAYDDPTAASDLNAFSNTFGLPDFNSGAGTPTFTKLNQTGGTALPGTDPAGPYSTTGGSDWEQEESLDIEWAHAIAPEANITLYEASNSGSGLYTAVSTARQTSGVTVVSMSFGGSEFSGQTSYDSTYFTTPSGHIGAGGIAGGITFVASSGDQGSYTPGTTTHAVEFPAASSNVLAVGGTSLTVNGTAYSGESAWGNGTTSGTNGGSGGGISSQEAQPAYQKGIVTQTSTNRAVPDVAMDADPNTGVPVYDSYDFGTSTPWIPGYEGGTSLAAPMWAGLVAIADQGRNISHLGSLDGSTQTLPSLYKLSSSDFHDITSGNNGYAAGTGYDLATGRGTPVANTLVPDLAGVSGGTTTSAPSAPTVSSLSANPNSVVSGSSFTLSANGVADPNAGGSITQVAFYRESNGTSGLQTTGDTLVGTATAGSNGVWSLSVNSTGLSAGSYTYYAVATDNSGLTSTPVSTNVTVTQPATSANSAKFVRTDSTTLGNWKGAYGTQGEYVAADSYTAAPYATLTTNGSTYTWASSSTSTQYLQRASSGRIGSMLYATSQLQVGVNITDGLTHQVAFYLPAKNTWSAQYEKVAAYDANNGAPLASQTVNTATGGQYVIFNVSGNVTFNFTPASAGYYGVVSGIFLDAAK